MSKKCNVFTQGEMKWNVMKGYWVQIEATVDVHQVSSQNFWRSQMFNLMAPNQSR